MIISLTIFLMIISIWSLFSFGLLVNSGDMMLDYKCDGLLVTIAKIYWWGILIFVIGSILFIICYGISSLIVCNSTNNDYPSCKKIISIMEE